MKKLAMTGVTGQKSGGAFARELRENAAAVEALFPDGLRALVRPTSDTAALERTLPGVELCRGDFTDLSFLTQSLCGVDTLVHIAGIHSSRALARAAADVGVRRLILVHTTGIYSKYKAAGEEYRRTDEFVYEMCRQSGIVLTILRPTMIYGNLSDHNVITFVRMVDRLPVMPVVSGARFALQPVHYLDLAHAYCQVLLHEAETADQDFNLSGAEPILLRDMLTQIGQCLGKPVHFFSVPFPIAYAGAVCLYALSGKRMDYREKVQRLCEPRVFSHEAASSAFGYAPRTFAEGVAPEVREYQRAKAAGERRKMD